MSAIGKAFEAIGHGIEDAFKGIGEVIKSAVTLDFKGMGKGLDEVVHGAMDVGRGLVEATPIALAANTLMSGGLDNLMQKGQKFAEKFTDGFVDGVAGDLDRVKDGVVNTVTGIATGDLSKIGGGFKDLVEGGLQSALDFAPGLGEAKVAMTAVETGIKMATDTAAKSVVSTALS